MPGNNGGGGGGEASPCAPPPRVPSLAAGVLAAEAGWTPGDKGPGRVTRPLGLCPGALPFTPLLLPRGHGAAGAAPLPPLLSRPPSWALL